MSSLSFLPIVTVFVLVLVVHILIIPPPHCCGRRVAMALATHISSSSSLLQLRGHAVVSCTIAIIVVLCVIAIIVISCAIIAVMLWQ